MQALIHVLNALPSSFGLAPPPEFNPHGSTVIGDDAGSDHHQPAAPAPTPVQHMLVACALEMLTSSSAQVAYQAGEVVKLLLPTLQLRVSLVLPALPCAPGGDTNS